jgi:hypothetical protein
MIYRFELIGASGVGKTTLFNRLCKTSIKQRSFITVKEAWKIGALQHRIPPARLRQYILQKLLRSGLVKNHEYGLSRKVLDIQNLKKRLINRDDYRKFGAAFELMYHYLENEENPRVVQVRIDNFLAKAEEFLVLDRLLHGEYAVLFDEGMIHHLEGLGRFQTDSIKPGVLSGDITLNPTGVIVCEQNEETIYRHIKNRQRSGVSRFSLDHLSDEELKDFIVYNIGLHRDILRSFTRRKIPVLRIDPLEATDVNLKKIDTFVTGVYETKKVASG